MGSRTCKDAVSEDASDVITYCASARVIDERRRAETCRLCESLVLSALFSRSVLHRRLAEFSSGGTKFAGITPAIV